MKQETNTCKEKREIAEPNTVIKEELQPSYVKKKRKYYNDKIKERSRKAAKNERIGNFIKM